MVPAAQASATANCAPNFPFPEDFHFFVQNFHSLKFHFPEVDRGSGPPNVYFFPTVLGLLGKTLVDYSR